MAKRVLKAVFPPDLIREPTLYDLSNKFKLVTNILRANVEIDKGWVVVELEGDFEEMDRSIVWMNEKGISVVPAEANSRY